MKRALRRRLIRGPPRGPQGVRRCPRRRERILADPRSTAATGRAASRRAGWRPGYTPRVTSRKVSERYRRANERMREEAQQQLRDGRPDRARRLLKACEDVVEHEFSPTQRRIFQLKHLRRQSIREIAGALGKSEDAVKANLYRMRRSILASAPGLDGLLREAR